MFEVSKLEDWARLGDTFNIATSIFTMFGFVFLYLTFKNENRKRKEDNDQRLIDKFESESINNLAAFRAIVGEWRLTEVNYASQTVVLSGLQILQKVWDQFQNEGGGGGEEEYPSAVMAIYDPIGFFNRAYLVPFHSTYNSYVQFLEPYINHALLIIEDIEKAREIPDELKKVFIRRFRASLSPYELLLIAMVSTIGTSGTQVTLDQIYDRSRIGKFGKMKSKVEKYGLLCYMPNIIKLHPNDRHVRALEFGLIQEQGYLITSAFREDPDAPLAELPPTDELLRSLNLPVPNEPGVRNNL